MSKAPYDEIRLLGSVAGIEHGAKSAGSYRGRSDLLSLPLVERLVLPEVTGFFMPGEIVSDFDAADLWTAEERDRSL